MRVQKRYVVPEVEIGAPVIDNITRTKRCKLAGYLNTIERKEREFRKYTHFPRL